MNIEKPGDIGRLIRARRHQLGWTQAMLAERAHTTRRWVSEAENGKTTAEIGIVLAALHVLGITLRSDNTAPHRTQSEPEPSAPSIAELKRLLERHVETNVPVGRRSFTRTNR